MSITSIIQSLISLISSLLILFNSSGIVTTPNGYFEDTKEVQVIFDEGVFSMGEYDLVVSPDGNDSNSGTLSEPLKTPEAAKEKLKSLKNADCGTITVWFREGTYTLENELVFNTDDCENVVYRSYPNEDVNFSGSVALTQWSDGKINNLDAFVTDIDTENLYFRSLFNGEKRLDISKWPKKGCFTVENSLDEDAFTPDESTGFFALHAAFYAKKNQVKNFKNLKDVNVRIMHKWCDDILPLNSVNITTGRIELTKPAAMTIEIGDNFVYENVKEAVSRAGEWYLDRSEGKLYYIPFENETKENLTLYAPVTEKLITINGVSGIEFSGINFINTDWDFISGTQWVPNLESAHPLYKNIKFNPTHPQAAFETPAVIYIKNSDNVNFTNCKFKNISNTAIKYDKGSTNSTVKSCLFDEIGGNAVFINGPFTIPAQTSGITVTDCHIRYYGRIYNNSIGVLLTHATDCNITHNEIHDGWYTAVSVGWNWGYTDNPTNNIKIQNNLIYNIGNGWLSDMGGIYTLGIQPDTVLSGNIIHNVGCYEGSTGYGGWGIYLDEGSSYITVEKNLAYDCSSNALHQHYGKDNLIKNNILALSGGGQMLITRHEEHNSLFLYNNILVSDDQLIYKTAVEKDWFTDNNNLYWDYTNEEKVFSGDSMDLGERVSVNKMQRRGYYNNAVFADPLFKDIENRDFTISTNSPALDTGFEYWDFEAGTYTLFE
ncbi:MAG: right-handed parallel beta-helix repeat-containing protein [Ruminococcaceae bacterium]|nr:right-handed parallel beta-helix repeat-containing protein [Oscillospiraceae bacterium]